MRTNRIRSIRKGCLEDRKSHNWSRRCGESNHNMPGSVSRTCTK